MLGCAPPVGRTWTAVLLTAMVLGACGQASRASASGLYVALGDSPTAGVGAPAGRGYVDVYFAYLRDRQMVGLINS